MNQRSRRASQRDGPEPVRITTAGTALSDDIAARSRRYLLQMGIRVVCFIGAVVIDHPIRWGLLAGRSCCPMSPSCSRTPGGSGPRTPVR